MIKKGISLFSSSGIGDIALKKNSIEVVVSNEIISDRCSIFRRNFPKTKLIEGDIWEKKKEIIDSTNEILKGKKLDFALVTPPCQGMSKNGRGKLLFEIKAGRRPKIDERNLLIIPAIEIIKKLNPTVVIFENVSEMKNTIIPYKDKVKNILDIIRDELKEWFIYHEVIEFADYGIPQKRQRLITIASKNTKHKKYHKKFGTLIPPKTHSENSENDLSFSFIEQKNKWITVREIIGEMEKLDGKSKIQSTKDPLHRIAKLDDKKYWWILNTKKSSSAFDNQCIKCKNYKNPTHKSLKDNDGVNKSSKKTPIYCNNCNSLLPRPSVKKNGKIRLMSGFTSAYKRMDWDSPATAITRNFPYACSDKKLHPEQHRTLSIREACLLHTINKEDFIFEFDNGKEASMTAIRDTLGESIPPKMLDTIILFLRNIENL